jgi:hypothetical protein
MVDALTFNGWMGKFCIWVASESLLVKVDLTVERCEDGTMIFVSNYTHTVWMAYCAGRNSGSMSSLVTVPVVTETNWHNVNTAARGG